MANCLNELGKKITMRQTRLSRATGWIHQEHWLALQVDGVEEVCVGEPIPVPVPVLALNSGSARNEQRFVLIAWETGFSVSRVR